MKGLIYSTILIFVFSCQEREIIKSSLLEITSSDTIFLPIRNVVYQNAKFQVVGANEIIFVQHGRKLFWINMRSGTIQEQVDLDTTDLVLPEVSLVNGYYDLSQKNTHLFFPQKNKILVLDSHHQQLDEIDLTGLDKIEHQFLGFGQAFYFHPSTDSYYIGIMSKKWQYNYSDFIQESSFIGVFYRGIGTLKFTFGGFSDWRKEKPIRALSEGVFHVDFDGENFIIRDAVGSPQITTFDQSGRLIKKDLLGNSKFNYELVSNDDNDISSGAKSDNHFTLKIISERKVVSNAIKLRDESKNIFEDRGLLFIEDLENEITYSRSIDPFQRIVSADENSVWLVRNHPKNEDLILVKVNYRVSKN